MGALFQLSMFFPSGKGRLSRIEDMLDLHSRFIEGIEAEDRATVRRNARGGITIGAQARSASGTGSAYASYFKLYNATTTAGSPQIGVTDAGWLGTGDPTNCGVDKVNGVRVDIPVFTETMTAIGIYYVWLHSWIDESTGEHAEIIVGDAGDTDEPDNPNDGDGYASQLLGRFTITSTDSVLSMTDTTQDYLRGGEHIEIIIGDCAGGAVEDI